MTSVRNLHLICYFCIRIATSSHRFQSGFLIFCFWYFFFNFLQINDLIFHIWYEWICCLICIAELISNSKSFHTRTINFLRHTILLQDKICQPPIFYSDNASINILYLNLDICINMLNVTSMNQRTILDGPYPTQQIKIPISGLTTKFQTPI